MFKSGMLLSWVSYWTCALCMVYFKAVHCSQFALGAALETFSLVSSLLTFSVLAMSHTCLDGVASEWESCADIRARVRNKNSFLAPALLHTKPVANIQCGEQNFHVLAPLAKRLLIGENEVGMHTVPDIQRENLNQ